MGVLFDLLKPVSGLGSAFGYWAQRVSLVSESLLTNGRPFITQTLWYVDATNGSDTNSGTSWSSALKTLPELALRFFGVFDPSITSVNVYLRGTFAHTLSLHATFATLGAVVTIRGEMSAPLHSGTITTYTGFTAASDVRASVAETGVDLSAYVEKRLRITSGVVEGAVTHVALGSGQTALIGQFNRIVSGSGVTSNPVNGVSYVVEDYATQIPSFDIEINGAFTVLRDVRVRGTSSSIRSGFKGAFGAMASATLFGCDLYCDSTFNFGGNFSMTGCQNRGGTLIFFFFTGRQIAHVAKAPVYFSDGSFAACFNNIHQGATATLSVDTGATVEDLGQRGMFAVGGAEAFTVNSMGRFFQLNSSSLLWGSGNTATATVRVWGPCQFGYFTKPTITGTGTDAVVGGVAKTWAQIPYIDIGAGTNNSGAMLVQQQ